MRRVVRPPDLVCPECGGPVGAVGLKTVKHLLDYPLSRAVAGEGWLFCADAECDVYYFRAPQGGAAGGAGAGGAAAEGAEAVAPTEAAAGVVALGAGTSGPEAPSAPEVFRAVDIKDRARPHARGADRLVCHCFGYTAADIAADAVSGRHQIPAAIAAEVRAGMCACEVLNPGGG
ncbi:MAG: hypothetical protein ACYC5Q_02510 [Thermoleophilia bacterium]